MAVEVFANLPAAVVTSGGTGSPSSGTTETWTVASSAGFPSVSSAAGTQIHVADITANSEIIAVTNISGATWTVTRGAEGTIPVAHVAGFAVYQVVTAGFSGSLFQYVGALAYGVVPDGATDNTTALQNAVNAAQAANLPLILPPGTIISGAVTVAAGNLSVRGPGRENCTLKLKNGTNGYLFTFSPGTGFITADFRDFGIHGNAENQASGGCVYGAGSVQSRFDNMHFQDAYDVCLWLYQNTGGGFGHHNRVTRSLFDNLNTVAGASQQGIRMQSCDENYIAFNDFENWGGTSGSPGSEPYAIKDWSGIQIITGNVFVSGQEAIRIQDTASTRVIGNTFDGTGRAGIHASGSKNVILGNLFSNGSSSSTGAYAQCEIDNSSSCVVDGNSFTVTTAGVVRNCVREFSSSSTRTVAANNVIDLTGGSLYGGNKAVELLGAASAARSNPGFNPVGPVTAPAVPASGAVQANTVPYDVTVYLTAGSSTCAVAVGGTSMYTVPAAGVASVRLPAGQSVTLTYANAPTWTWAAD